jgi:alkanesulfonate monooxygenase SsuD/methylene tetrahydromethanopterin reductase-like flavin-dependent oxidoreductase (luciferase family)
MKTMMKFAISYNTAYYGVDPDKIVAYARHAEACGFEALYLPEHIVLYPGARVGSTEIPPSLPIADPLDCLSFVAAATQRILLGTAALLLPYHHPVVLAKRLATIDVLSKGRMRLLTVGLGTLPGEAHAVGVGFGTRGRRADEAIDVLRLLWAGGDDGVSFDGEFFAFDNLCSFPKPYGITTYRSTSADRVGRPLAAPGGAATATFLAVRSVPTNAACSGTSPGRPPLTLAVTPKRWSTRAGDRLACPSNGSRHSPRKA